MIRPALYAGTWYPDTIEELRHFLNKKAAPRNAIACVCPHAGWIYSGKTAGLVYSSITPKKLYILIGPNHTGIGAPISVFPEGEWETPLGRLEVDSDTAGFIIKNYKPAKADIDAHLKEHSIEVQLPFIKMTSPDAKIVPIALADYSAEACKGLAEAVSSALKEKNLKDDTLVVASSDMSHYVTADEARVLDEKAIKKMLEFDPDGLLKTVKENNITMCGSGPAAVAMWTAKTLGAKKASLVSYTNSGNISGDYKQVVGYAGLLFA